MVTHSREISVQADKTLRLRKGGFVSNEWFSKSVSK
jgi:ABC-type lipoprotein export system ATPase subunit